MKCYCFGSSSAGNCYVLSLEGATSPLMVECGVEWKKVVKQAVENGIDLSAINTCLITHAHQDHCRAWKDANLNGLRLCASKDTLDILGATGQELECDSPNSIGNGYYVLPFMVIHDIAGAYGFVIKTSKECVIFVNDNKGWIGNLKSFKPNYVFMECNYYDLQVEAVVKHAKKIAESGVGGEEGRKAHNDLKLLSRNLDSHSSLVDTAKNLENLNLTNCKGIFLMHLSNRYANEYEMKSLIKNKFKIDTFVCQMKGGIK